MGSDLPKAKQQERSRPASPPPPKGRGRGGSPVSTHPARSGSLRISRGSEGSRHRRKGSGSGRPPPSLRTGTPGTPSGSRRCPEGNPTARLSRTGLGISTPKEGSRIPALTPPYRQQIVWPIHKAVETAGFLDQLGALGWGKKGQARGESNPWGSYWGRQGWPTSILAGPSRPAQGLSHPGLSICVLSVEFGRRARV